MIQRVQSLYLLAALGFLLPMFFMTVSSRTADGATFNLAGFTPAAGATEVLWSLALFGGLICLLTLLTIFLYKHRVLQMRLCVYNIILMLGMLGVVLWVTGSGWHHHLPIVFPVVAAILHYLAFRGIRRDELMVQALSRLR